jgi:hypothetical protein
MLEGCAGLETRTTAGLETGATPPYLAGEAGVLMGAGFVP